MEEVLEEILKEIDGLPMDSRMGHLNKLIPTVDKYRVVNIIETRIKKLKKEGD